MIRFRWFFLLFFLVSVLAGAWTTDLKAIKTRYDQAEIVTLFEQARRYEWLEEYQEKNNAIYILTSKFLYRARLLDDETLVFDQVQSRYDYDMQFPFWTIILVFIISAALLILIFFLPAEFRFWKKKG
ncbi:MAG TPA: hypothetical protein PLZ22_02910 [Thermotogota bacterium]|nr:hypothetical protein [Thermotogota bacterium]HPM21294.1 hypothetical protein [Thermotogota bacterium]